MKDLVSIIIPFFNRIERTKKSIYSALGQTYRNKEIILINDGSTEDIKNIEEIAAKYEEIYLYSSKKNSGPSFARNLGMKIANGKFIAFLDSDDEWFNFKLSYQINYMLEKNLKFTYTSYLRNCIEKNKIKLVKVSKRQKFPLNAFRGEIATPTVILEKSISKNIEFPEEIKFGEDIIYWAKLSERVELHGINIPTALINVKKSSSANNLISHKKGFANINKYLFRRNFLLRLVHKIFYEIVLLIKSIINSFAKK